MQWIITIVSTTVIEVGAQNEQVMLTQISLALVLVCQVK